jgi:hypothetical protein
MGGLFVNYTYWTNNTVAGKMKISERRGKIYLFSVES